MSGGGISLPGLSSPEKELQRQQAELLGLQRRMIEEQNQQNRVLLPFLAQQEGFDVTVDDNGIITGISRRPDPSLDRQKEIQRLLEERSLAALKGELPVDPALEENLADKEREVRDRLIAQLGPGYETSSAGIETLGDFFKNAEMLREGARTGQLTLAEQLGLTRAQQGIFGRQSGQDVLRTAAVGDPLSFAGAFGQVARGYGQAQVPFIQQRAIQSQMDIARRQQNMGLVGAGIGALGAIFSDPDDDDVVVISRLNEDRPIYTYTDKATGKRVLGVWRPGM